MHNNETSRINSNNNCKIQRITTHMFSFLGFLQKEQKTLKFLSATNNKKTILFTLDTNFWIKCNMEFSTETNFETEVKNQK